MQISSIPSKLPRSRSDKAAYATLISQQQSVKFFAVKLPRLHYRLSQTYARSRVSYEGESDLLLANAAYPLELDKKMVKKSEKALPEVEKPGRPDQERSPP